MARVGDNPNFQGLGGQIAKNNEPLKQHIEDAKTRTNTKGTEEQKPVKTAENEQKPPVREMSSADIYVRKFKPQIETAFKVGSEIYETLLQQVLAYAKDPKNNIPKQTINTIADANQAPTYAKNKGLTEENIHRLRDQIDKIAKKTNIKFPGSARVAKELIEYFAFSTV